MSAGPATAAPQTTIHAGCVLIDEAGVLIRGPSGSGKSRLALALIACAHAHGRFASLVADDRCRLAARGGRLIARPAEAIAGLVEVRGLGIMKTVFTPSAVVRLVVDCFAAAPERYPQSTDRTVTIEGIELPCIRILCEGGGAAAAVVLGLLGRIEMPLTHGLSE